MAKSHVILDRSRASVCGSRPPHLPQLPQLPPTPPLHDSAHHHNMEAPVQNRRMRTLRACDTCRRRKRKCNGQTPCDTCTEWGYDCYMDGTYCPTPTRSSSSAAARFSRVPLPPPRDRFPSGVSASAGGGSGQTEQIRDVVTQGPISPVINTPESTSASTPGERSHPAAGGGHARSSAIKSLAANSGAAFVRRMGLKLDPANAPRLNLFGWNIGARELASGAPNPSGLPIVGIVSYEDMKKLAEVYMRKVDPCYGFLDQADFYKRLATRWEFGSPCTLYDSVLAGVGALGLLFSERAVKITEILLVEAAKSILESYDGSSAPSVELIIGWLLRVIYMRMTAPPYATWLASCKLIHLIEAAGLHREAADDLTASTNTLDPKIRRRILGVALHQNLWTSYDLGLSRVSLKTDILSLPLRTDLGTGDFTEELLGLLQISINLDPEQEQDDHDLMVALNQILDRGHTKPPSLMAQTNVVLCILRRLHLLNINTSSNLTTRVLQLTRRALEAARTLVEECSPWHHMPNVPFNIITILLELDTYSALAQLPEALETLKLIASAYNTATMREAYATARLLAYLYQKRRSHDAQMLGSLLSRLEFDSDNSSIGGQTVRPNLEEVPFLEELISDIPTLQGFDFEEFLNMDFPGFSEVMDFSGDQ
ncbi:hypothetical protein BJY01DRAFT_228510 [Aspergillus pseudoustus]|uniref:Zn(2)-C6 fungal-type domain-containing protein n=1 Tax=Aspergillus pseudoustus TaxID=1810923 RepID=A0ABR4IKN8_9EURO